jgi:hypothetical protein
MPTSCRTVSFVAASVLVAQLALAHDFWLVPDPLAPTPSGEIVVRGQTSSAFPTTLSAVTPDRVTEARVIGAVEDERITSLTTQGNSLVLRHRPKTPGQKIVGVAIGWRHVNETAASFRKYLIAEGAEAALHHYDRTGELPTADIVRRYAKYGKTVVEVGSGPRAFDRIVGHPLEFVPLSDPGAGTVVPVRIRLTFQGKPLGGVRVHAGKAPVSGQEETELSLTTSSDGVVSVPADGGLWNVRTIHVVPAPSGADANWDVHWATFVYSRK